jgi:hypothetical protein
VSAVVPEGSFERRLERLDALVHHRPDLTTDAMLSPPWAARVDYVVP